MAYSWRKLEELFNQAISLTPEALALFMKELEKEDQELREVLTMMIDAALKEGDYMSALQHKMAKAAIEGADNSVEIGSQLGKFKITKRLGKGGMGEVFLAERADGDLEQSVAIKVLSKSLTTKVSHANFKNEQQILASLKHPFIAQLYDAGITENNHPYFIMEYVEGESIDSYCKRNKLNLKERLVLFKKVCEAVEYAHKNLILHQDIKPENIVVSKDGYIKLLDFGIAKLMSKNQRSSDKNFSGSPYYASPEQLQGKNVSTASDVYQLGILMFKLLTDELPFEVKRENDFLTRAYDEPVLPPSLSTEKRIRKRKLRGELDAMVLKSLKAEASERYQNVSELIEDIERYEQKRPVIAMGKNRTYRFKKYLSRNAITVFFVSLIIGILSAASLINYRQYQEAEHARIIAENTSSFLKDLFTSANPFRNNERDYKQFSVYDFLEEKKVALFEDQSLPYTMRWEMLEIVYLTYKNLSIDEKAIEVGEEMLKLAQNANNRLWEAEANFYIGKAYAMDYMYDKSAPYFKNVYEVLPILEKENPIMAASLLKEVGLSIHLSGNYDSAEYLYKEALATFARHQALADEEAIRTYGNYSQLMRSTGRLQEALLMANKAVERREELYDENDLNLASNYGDRALIHMEMANYKESESDFEKALGITLQHLDSTNQTFEVMAGNYAIMLMLKGDAAKAYELNNFLYKHAVNTYGFKSMFTVYAQIQFGENLLYLGEDEQAEEMIQTAINNAEQLLPEGHTIIGMLYSLSAQIALKLTDFEQAMERANSAVTIFEKSLPQGHYRIQLANIRHLYAKAAIGDEEAAKTLQSSAREFLEKDFIHFVYQQEVEWYLAEKSIVNNS